MAKYGKGPLKASVAIVELMREACGSLAVRELF
jgi:hypothetical protein